MTKEQIKEIRKRLGLTQEQLAAQLGCSRPRIAEWETGRYKISNAYAQLLTQLEQK